MGTYLTPSAVAERLGVAGTRGLAARCQRIGVTPIRLGHRTYRYSADQLETALAVLAGETPTPVHSTDPLTGGRRR